MMAKPKKPAPFKHTVREIAVLNRAHASMMANIRAGKHYDVVKRAWVDTNELTIKPQN